MPFTIIIFTSFLKMELFQLNTSHFDQIVTVKASFTSITKAKDDTFLVKMQSLTNNGEMPSVLGGIITNEINEQEILDGHKLIVGKFICPKKSKNVIYNPYLEITQISPLVLNENENDNSNEEEEHEKLNNFFTKENLSDLRFNTGEEFFQYLQFNAYACGFKLSTRQAHNDSFIALRCYYHKSNSQIYDNCNFKINLQAHNYNRPNQYYEVSKIDSLEHTHPLDPFLFCHLILNEETKKTIKSLSDCNVDNVKIADYIEKTTSISMTTAQIRHIINSQRQKEIKAETEYLEKKMSDEEGISYVMKPIEIGNTIYRRAIATFSKNELVNLQKYGDLISIDPTYCNLRSNWSVIPLTVIGSSREILSGGCVFCSNVNNDIYQWLIKLLAIKLPCSSLLKTIVSDDDVALDSAFSKMGHDPIISCIKRIICIWHKYQHFKELVNKLSLSPEDKNELILKFRNMFLTRNEEKCLFLLNELKGIESLKSFIENSVETRLATSTKAFTKNVWSLGYITSSISEIHNSNIKHLLGSKALTLCEMRDIITQAERRREMNRHYIKERKIRKVYGSKVIDFMKLLKIDKRIAEAINGSFDKTENLTVTENDTFWIINEIKTGDSFYVKNSKGWSCSCGKMSSCGLPCSHILKVLIAKDILAESLGELISSRWILSNENLESSLIIKTDELTDFEIETSDKMPSVKKRYLEIKSRCQTIAELASKNEASYENVIEALDIIEKKLIGIIVDAHGTRSGRHRKSRIKHSTK